MSHLGVGDPLSLQHEDARRVTALHQFGGPREPRSDIAPMARPCATEHVPDTPCESAG